MGNVLIGVTRHYMISLPNSIQIPIIVFDELLPKITTTAELKVVLLAFRYYPQSISYDILVDHPIGLQETAIKSGLKSALEHKILLKKKDLYLINFDMDLNELKTPIRAERALANTLHARLMEAVNQLSNKTCNFKMEASYAKRLGVYVSEGRYTEQDILDCMAWATKHEFNWFAPSLLSVGKLMPKYMVLKKSGTLDTYKETKQEAQGRKLEEFEAKSQNLAKEALNESY